MKHSIVLPLYNHEEFIESALMSCYKQDHRNIEIVIVDDCSSDSSASIVDLIIEKKYFKNRFSKVVFQKNKKNLGSVSTIVEGLTAATGDVIHILNTDDYFSSRRISSIEQVCCGNKQFWGFTGVRPVDQAGNLVKDESLPDSIADVFDYYRLNKSRFQAIELAFLERNIAVSSGNLFFSPHFKGLWNALKQFRYCADWLFCIGASFVNRPVLVDERLLNYRIHGNNSFSSLKEVGEIECDIISLVCEMLFLDSDLRNDSLKSDVGYHGLKNRLKSGYLSVEQRQSWRGSLGINVAANFEYTTFACRFRDYLKSTVEISPS